MLFLLFQDVPLDEYSALARQVDTESGTEFSPIADVAKRLGLSL